MGQSFQPHLLTSLVLGLLIAGCGDGRTADGSAEASSAGTPPAPASQADAAAGPSGRPACDPDDGGIKLPEGFCALVVADDVGYARHIAVAPNGDLYVALEGGRLGGGGVLALRDTTGDGKADVKERFGGEGGTGLLLRDGMLFFAPDDKVLRFRLDAGVLVPSSKAEEIVDGLPANGGHTAKSVAVGSDGSLYVNVGSRTNSCQEEDRNLESPGIDPCTELEHRAGIWRFDSGRTNQSFRDGERFATGLRNVVALTIHPRSGALYGLQHGRDQLFQNWPKLYDSKAGAEKPAEEMVRLEKGDDFGWPYCYDDPALGKLVLAPEYGGDGKEVGRCAGKKPPVHAFPAHWAPIGVLFYTGEQFPDRYRGGAFIAFHGSWNRAPEPQGGYNLTFLPFEGERPAGEFEVFADGFAGSTKDPRNAAHRPTGLAQGPDGSLYVADDQGGRIWRILYTGDGAANAKAAPAPRRTPEG
jgi:glucose/arabinose dehydrogenase